MGKPAKMIVDLKMLNTLTGGCPGCGRSFSLGEPVVSARGEWEGGPKLIHANEAVYDPKTSSYIERKFYETFRRADFR